MNVYDVIVGLGTVLVGKPPAAAGGSSKIHNAASEDEKHPRDTDEGPVDNKENPDGKGSEENCATLPTRGLMVDESKSEL
jgi:hypothetical protein